MLYILAIFFPPIAATIAAPDGKKGNAFVINFLCCFFGLYVGGVIHAMITVSEYSNYKD